MGKRYFLEGKTFRGYLDRLRQNLETLDGQIENARQMSKVKKNGDNPGCASVDKYSEENGGQPP